MDKIKDFIKNKKKLVMIIGGVLIVIVVILVIFLVVKPSFIKQESTKEKYERYLKEMGKDFWENHFYDSIGEGERNEFLSKFQSIGIKVDLDSLGRYNTNANRPKIAELINPKTNEACDSKTNRVIIYPKGNFGKMEYDLEVELDCGLEEESKK